ncbi:hypothetical protein CVT26_011261 [Gymnopilus dilepis]|uniref:Disease resistance R13L4/SHOC-2-like LRR domain-containing protein n=1 Tax=Gymnopilus dilepis TaxID=231916 RepID=A0A409VZ00_9AGAR|nr:hypothetical protein CVT26_011261 [Gymnopilus dilepis]
MLPDQDPDDGQTSQNQLSLTQIAEAVRSSPDGGTTIVLSKLGLNSIGSVEAEQLALGKASGNLQQSGSTVERLALGSNRLLSLPPEFAFFTRLRYLNLKHNSFAAFPEVLNLLPSLDTLDISHNKIKRLPSTPGNLVRLRVLCLSRNKLERLPHYITQFENLEVLHVDRNPLEWPPIGVIDNLVSLQPEKDARSWIRDLFTWMETEGEKTRYDDSGYGELGEWDPEPLRNTHSRESKPSAASTPHARSLSLDSNASTSSPTESLSAHEFADDIPHFASYHSLMHANLSDELPSGSPPSKFPSFHRDNSGTGLAYSSTQFHGSVYPKALPQSSAKRKSHLDLRPLHKEPTPVTPNFLEDKLLTDGFQVQNDSNFQLPHQDSALLVGHSSAKPRLTDEALASITPDVISKERNSYFRRSYAQTKSYALPKPLFRMFECARSILFATGQLYQALRNYQESAERTAPILEKVLEPAYATLMYLIRSLDRFEDVSRKATPSPSICRRVLESCKDTITAFKQAIVLVGSQISINTPQDVRYMRWLILEFYGISAELSTAWQTIVPDLEHLKPFLSGAASSITLVSGTADYKSPVPSDFCTYDEIKPVARSRCADSLNAALGPGRTRTARRHAGSFSSKDVEIGKELPSYDALPALTGGVATRTPMLRTPKRLMTLPIAAPSFQSPYYPNFSSSYTTLPVSTGLKLHRHNASQGSFDIALLPSPTPTDSLMTDILGRETLQMIRAVVDLTPTICDQVAEALGGRLVNTQELADYLESACTLSKKLHSDVFDLSEGKSDKADVKAFRESARLFLEVILHLLDLLQVQHSPDAISDTLKFDLQRLIHYAEEIMIAPFAATGTPSGSPTFPPKSNTYGAYPQRPEDNEHVPNFLNSRIAQLQRAGTKPLNSMLPDLAPGPLTVSVKPSNT